MSWTRTKRKLINAIEFDSELTKHGIRYTTFENVPISASLKKEDIGKLIWWASLPRTAKVYLLEINEDNYYIKLEAGSNKVKKHLHKTEAILHPKEWTKERFNEQR